MSAIEGTRQKPARGVNQGQSIVARFFSQENSVMRVAIVASLLVVAAIDASVPTFALASEFFALPPRDRVQVVHPVSMQEHDSNRPGQGGAGSGAVARLNDVGREGGDRPASVTVTSGKRRGTSPVNFATQVPFSGYGPRVAAAGWIDAGRPGVRQPESHCGNGICEASEDLARCRADCRRPAPVQVAGRIADRGLAPRGTLLGDGVVLIGLTRAVPGGSLIQAMVTTHRGDRWRVRGTVEEKTSAGAGDLGNPVPFRDRQGRVLMAFRDHQTTAGGERKYQLRIEFSDDEGHTWHRWSEDGEGIIDRSDFGLWEPFLYYDAHGHLRVVYAKERAPQLCRGRPVRKQDIVTKVSRDGGRNWGDEAVVASAGLSRDGVPSVARLRDGSFVLVFESWRNEDCASLNPALVIRSMQSRDGVTWTKRRAVYVPQAKSQWTPAPPRRPVASWPYVIRLRDGRVLVLFTTDEDRLLARAEGTAKDRDFDIKYVVTRHEATYESLEWDDAGAQVAYAMTAADEEIRYASAVELDDGNVLLLFARPARYGILQLH